uniref:Uncharacterized protein n=1 Tax=Manihot esculenta TaxID=3983 RepID=A0A2C9UGC8_MANES
MHRNMILIMSKVVCGLPRFRERFSWYLRVMFALRRSFSPSLRKQRSHGESALLVFVPFGGVKLKTTLIVGSLISFDKVSDGSWRHETSYKKQKGFSDCESQRFAFESKDTHTKTHNSYCNG